MEGLMKMNYKNNQKYFAKFSLKAPIMITLFGLIVFLVGVDKSVGTIFFGLLLIAAGVGSIVMKVKGKVSDEEYDSGILMNLKEINKRALDKLGVDEDEVNEISPITFDGYVVKGFDHAKKGKDNKWRTNRYRSTTLLFSANEVHCYTYTFSTTEEKKSEETDVYFYKDIVSVSTASDTIRFNGETKDTEFEYFKLTTAAGTALQVALRDIDGAQRSINAMRQLLKQKKMA